MVYKTVTNGKTRQANVSQKNLQMKMYLSFPNAYVYSGDR